MLTLKNLLIKPILECNANCIFCEGRLSLYKKILTADKAISLKKWREIIRSAISLGLRSVTISGGEPLLYENLYKLIKICKNHKLVVNLNTNAYYLNQKAADALLDAGLDACTISLYSASSRMHDELKGVEGIFNKAVKAIELLQSHKIPVNLQTILMKVNMFELPDFLEFISAFNISKLFISYLEGKVLKLAPDNNDIKKFISETVPDCINKMKSLYKNSDTNIAGIKNLFIHNDSPDLLIASGVYNSGGKIECAIPKYRALVLATGNVYPCNGAEYFHKPLAGNLFESTLEEIWNSKIFESTRSHGSGWCRYCPMMRHIKLELQ